MDCLTTESFFNNYSESTCTYILFKYHIYMWLFRIWGYFCNLLNTLLNYNIVEGRDRVQKIL